MLRQTIGGATAGPVTERLAPRRARLLGAASVVAVAAVLVAGALAAVTQPRFPSDGSKPDPVALLAGYDSIWLSDGADDLHGTVRDPAVLRHDDRLAVWINRNATAAERFLALQDSEYQNAQGTAYDQSITVSTGMGAVLGKAYVKGMESGALPLTKALINSSNGTSGAYLGSGAAKAAFSHPRPYLPSDADAAPVAGDSPGCAPARANASSQRGIRSGAPWADDRGDLLIARVPPVTDTTHQFSPNDVALDAAYGSTGLCLGGSFPSGHTMTAYQAGLTLATLLPELGPEILARASENGNNRIVLGVHYPLDVMGGRIAGEAALAARWSDAAYRAEVLQPARAELLAYLRKATGHSLAWAIRYQSPYRSDPYGGRSIPGGSAQRVVNRASAVEVFGERLTYGFPQSGPRGRPPSVPAGASNLLLTTFPTLTDAQRRSVLAQTEIPSGYPLDRSDAAGGSWQRLDLAAAMSATVVVAGDTVRVTATGGVARVIRSSR